MPALRLPPTELIAKRLVGPGDLYNLGNIVGFVGGLIIAIANTLQIDETWSSILHSTIGYVAGGPSSLLLSAATAIFFVSGEFYARAYTSNNLSPPSLSGIRLGDLLSSVGAVVLCAGLYVMDHSALALASGVLHAGGKLGSAAIARPRNANDGAASLCRDLFRYSVLISRVPGIAVAMMSLSATAVQPRALGTAMSLTMLLCYLLWGTADFMLLANEKTFAHLHRQAIEG